LIRLFVTFVETSYLNTDKCWFESLHTDKSRARSAGSSKDLAANREHLLFHDRRVIYADRLMRNFKAKAFDIWGALSKAAMLRKR